MAHDYLARVRNLLDAADGFEREADREQASRPEYAADRRATAQNYRERAEGIMVKFRIEQEELLAQDATAATPVRATVDLCAYPNEYSQAYINLFYVAAQHAGVRTAYQLVDTPGTGYTYTASVVGYQEDITYAEMIFTAARLVFSERLEPKVRGDLSEQENVYRLRGAGIERVRVADMVWGNRDKGNLAKVGRLYLAECAKRGETPALSGRGVTGKVYREEYAKQFPWALDERLRRYRDAAGQMGGGLVLHGRKERVDEAFYAVHPEYRPKPAVEQAGPSECGACKKTKHETGLCKDHRPRRETEADRARMRRLYSPTARAGRAAGTAAAAHVQLDRAGREAVEDGGRGSVERVAFELEG